MAIHWNEGAIVDVAARPRFHRETMPVWLAAACTFLGCRAPDLTQPFRYADLGCGAGLDAIIVAATCPRAEVWGFDFNPMNIESARDLATRAGLTNIRFEESSFSGLVGSELPQFDFMIVEAVLGVISRRNEAYVLATIERNLRAGGLAYLGYQTDTGWTEFGPIQTLMRILTEQGINASEFAVPLNFDFLDRLKSGGAMYFVRNPVLERKLAEIRRRSEADVALQFLNQDWRAMMFADVADAMAEVKCEFLGRATLHENIESSSVPPAMLPLLEEAQSIRIRETMQDIAAGTGYRRDIYRRGLAFQTVAEHRARIGAMTVLAISDGDLTLPTWQGPMPADPALYQPLVRALRDGKLSVGVAHTLGSLAGQPIEAAADALAMLIASGRAHPVMPDPVAQEASAQVSRLNGAIVDAVTRGEDFGYLVSPLIGSAVEANPLEILTTGALLQGGNPMDLDDLTRDVMVAMTLGGRSVTRGGVPVEDGEEARTILREIVARIVEHRVPLFRRLRVLPL
jgi:SAM-dependent methyltransferase